MTVRKTMAWTIYLGVLLVLEGQAWPFVPPSPPAGETGPAMGGASEGNRVARMEGERAPKGPAEPASHCLPLFGLQGDRSQNSQTRRRLLEEVNVSSENILIIHHSTEWEEPRGVEFQGLTLVGTREEAGRQMAIVRISRDVAEEFGCPQGRYKIGPDVTLGGSAAVLAVLDGLIIMDQGGELTYIKGQDSFPPTFRMVWESPWSMMVKHETKRSSKKPSSKRKPPKRKPKPRRPPPRGR